MLLTKLVGGPLDANCYILGDEETKDAAVIDPGCEDGRILDVLKKKNLRLIYIINTHGHFDHIGANQALKDVTGAKIVIHEGDKDLLMMAGNQIFSYGLDITPSKADIVLKDGDEIKIGSIILKVIHTPGHSKGGICLLGEDFMFTGDTIFAGSVGRTDFPEGDTAELYRSIRAVLDMADDAIRVLPGHGPETTIGEEKRNNLFFREIMDGAL